MMQANAVPVEYTVYTFDLPSPSRQKGDVPWKRHFCSPDRELALQEAQKLLRTRRFDRIEIKKKFYDTRQARLVDQTYRILGRRRQIPSMKTALKFMIGGEMLALAVFCLSAIF